MLGLTVFGASCGTAKDGGVFQSQDRGESWAQKVFVGQQKKKVITIADVNVEAIFFDPVNPDVMYMGSKTTGLYKTETAGEQWIQLATGATRVRDVAFHPTNTATVYALRSTDIILSTDAGQTWDTIYTDPQGGVILQILVDWYDPTHLLASTSVGTILVSNDSGVTWKVLFEADEPITELIMDPTDSRIMYALELERNIYRTVDGGASWSPLFSEEFRAATDTIDIVRSLVMDPNSAQTLYTVTPDGIYRSIDSGSSWSYITTLIANGADQNSSIRNLVVIPGSPDTILFTQERIIHKTEDNGTTWKTIENFPSGRRITALAVDSDRPDIIYAGTELVEEKKGLIR